MAQGTTTISGVVTDASGGVVVGASVTVTNVLTNAERSATTNELGFYTVGSLQPGEYSVDVQAPGFQRLTQSGVTVEIDRRIRVDASLQVGQVTEVVEVSAETVTVNTQDAVIKEVIDERRVVDLPLNGRSPLQLMLLVPGVHAIEGAAARGIGGSFTPAGQQLVASSGSRGNEINYVLDGGYNQDDYRSRSNAFPNPDFLQEFSLQTNSFSAEHGRFSGGVANAVTKSGTNDFHGTVFEFLRNNKLNATNFFASQDDGLKRNQWGATIGGPVFLPNYSGRDRTFFFFGYQGTKVRQRPTTSTALTPTARQRTGDFGDFFDSKGDLIEIHDPDTLIPYPNNVIPGSQIDPVVPRMLESIPVAQDADGTARYPSQTIFDGYEFQARMDHNFSDRDRLFVRIFRHKNTRPNTGIEGNILSFRTAQLDRSFNGRIQYDRTVSPTTLFTSGFTFNRSFGLRQGTTPFTFQDIGVNAPPAGASDDMRLDVIGFFRVILFGDTPLVRNAFQYQASLSKITGRHNLRMGFEANRRQFNIPIVNVGFHGTFSFNRGLTGSRLSDFVLGRPSVFSQSSGFQVSLRKTDWIGWVSDEIKLNPRLTMTLGLRFEPFLAWKDTWRPGFPQVAAFIRGQQSRVFPNIGEGLNFFGDPGVSERLVPPDWTKFSPRLGLSFDPFGDGRMSIRAGYGIFRLGFPAVSTQNIGASIPAFNATVNIENPASFSEPFQGQPPPPWPAKTVPFDTEFPGIFRSRLVQSTMQQPYTQQWNFSIERQLPGDWLGAISYQGSKGTKLFGNFQPNYSVYVPGESTKRNIQQRRLFPHLGQIQEWCSCGFSQYHGLVLSGSKRFSNSYSVLASYTFSKLIDHGSASLSSGGGGFADPTNWALDQGLADFHHKHIASISYVWDLPRLEQQNPVVRAIFGNWQNLVIHFTLVGGAGLGGDVSVGQCLTENQLLDESVEDLAHVAGLATVETKGEFIEVALEMYFAHLPLVSRYQPALQQRGNQVDMPEFLGCQLRVSCRVGDSMAIAGFLQAPITFPAVGMDQTAWLRTLAHKTHQTRSRCVGDMTQTDSPHFAALQFHRNHDQCFAHKLSSANVLLLAAQVSLVDLDTSAQPLASQSHHRLPQLLQHQPGRLIAAQTEFALQTLGAQPCFLGARQPHCQKPTPQRYPRVVQDGSRRGRGLPLAGATEHRSSPGRPSLRGRAIRANEPHWPADTDQILATGLLAGKPFSELHQMLWKVVAQQSRSSPPTTRSLRVAWFTTRVKWITRLAK